MKIVFSSEAAVAPVSDGAANLTSEMLFYGTVYARGTGIVTPHLLVGEKPHVGLSDDDGNKGQHTRMNKGLEVPLVTRFI